jgi:hypothetical protein
MFYWIYDSPPGYSGAERYLVRECMTDSLDDLVGPWAFAASVEEARTLVPEPRQRIERELPPPFIELWKSPISN